MDYIDISLIGKFCLNLNETSKLKSKDQLFVYNGLTYELLVEIDPKQLIRDIQKVPAFSFLHIEQSENNQFLYLIFRPSLLLDRESPLFTYSHSAALKRIVDSFFIIKRNNIFEDDDDDIDSVGVADFNVNDSEKTNVVAEGDGIGEEQIATTTKITIEQLYQELREAHDKNDKFSTVASDIQHRDLKPTLTNYQIDAVRWMLEREKNADYFPTEFVQIYRRWPVKEDGQTFFYNARTIELSMVEGCDIKLPSGGILAEEMGLGKTVEILALILLNERDSTIIRANQYNNNELIEPQAKKPKLDCPNDKVYLKCICIKKSMKHLVRCTKCLNSQHRNCVLKYSSGCVTEVNYICPECWQYEASIPSCGTFIVSPASIKMQWYVEIQKHIASGRLKVLVYDGIQKIWISPAVLATYDIVLTDYNIMRTELNFSALNKVDRNLRRPNRRINPVSPLLLVDWWRVCLDEAQMAESVNTKSAQMVQKLPTQHRWAVTGTPIQKSLHDLYGLLHFLNIEPYTDRLKWNKLIWEFYQCGTIEPLISVLKKIMWRTSKTEQILKQIKIPPQSEIIHYVAQSDLEKYFYNEEHAKYLQAFEEKAHCVGLTMAISSMNPHILKLIMEPLRKLRHDCTVPRVFERDKRFRMDDCLRPDQLLKYLVKNNENKTKSELRTIGSALNGIAALHIIKGENALAIKKYKAVLRYAKDYVGTISMDTLLQVHAIHNLLQIDTSLTTDERTEYEMELHELEWKYIHKNATLIQSFKIDQQKFATEIYDLRNKFTASEYHWWAHILKVEDERNDSTLLRKIITEMRDKYSDITIDFNTVYGVLMLLTTWIDKINEERRNVQQAFGKIQFFIENMRPKSEINDDITAGIQHLVTNAFQCHLNTLLEKELESKRRREKQKFCLMCKVKNILDTYECVIFDKKFVHHKVKEDTEQTEGSWKPPYQELILKIIHAHCKNKYSEEEIQEDSKIHMQYLDAIKNEYKEYSQLWVEVNFTLSAYDEINMCKSRLRAVDPDECEKQSKLNISKYEVNDTLAEQTNSLHQAELEFIKKLGTLRYLRHLELNKEVENCPICTQKPEEKFAVLECGHHMCMICFHRWTNTQTSILKCFICRHQQHRNKVYHVTLQNGSKLTNSSTKIEEIIQTIMNLREKDLQVKIVIFSHWPTILKVIEEELHQLMISFRSRLSKFHLTIDEFKDPDLNVTCLLLPLKYGSKGLNLIEATHVFLIEPILNPGEELQAVGRVHRMGQTKPTFVHRFIVRDTIEENIFQTISTDKSGKWSTKECTVGNLLELFKINIKDIEDDTI